MITLKQQARALAWLGAAGVLAAIAEPVCAQPPPRLAPGVEAAKDLVAPKTRYVVTNGTPIYRTPAYAPGQETGQELKRGDHPQILGETNMGGDLLVGRNGVGVGYVPRGLLCPVNLCPNVSD